MASSDCSDKCKECKILMLQKITQKEKKTKLIGTEKETQDAKKWNLK